jgi:uncharacterized Zn finger protein (UPF0148 family)
VLRDRLVLVCPVCQQAGGPDGTDWTAALDHCPQCGSAHLIRRLGQIECLDCAHIRELVDATHLANGTHLAHAAHPACTDAALAEEVSRALDRVLGRR